MCNKSENRKLIYEPHFTCFPPSSISESSNMRKMLFVLMKLFIAPFAFQLLNWKWFYILTHHKQDLQMCPDAVINVVKWCLHTFYGNLKGFLASVFILVYYDIDWEGGLRIINHFWTFIGKFKSLLILKTTFKYIVNLWWCLLRELWTS